MLFAVFALSSTAMADTSSELIAAAKATQTVGEQPDGYLGFVVSEVDEATRRAVRETNIKRKAVYRDLALKTGTTIGQVGALTAEKTIARAKPGQKYMNKDGQWVTK